jgi:KipI family sensor histidine kinase inhibitor
VIPRILPYGDHALLVELADLDAVLGLFRGLDASRPDGVIDLVPAARTLAVVVDPRILPLSAATAWVERTAPRAAAASEERVVELEVRYDGPDLADAARLTGRTEADVVGFHTGTSWRVAFGGFAPGFAYLVPDGPPLDVPRRTTPRTAVPAGSVGLAGGFSGVYPRESPGGWQLIGSTDAQLWDETADPPALLRPGTVVRFREVR